MAEHERTSQKKQDDVDQQHRLRQKESQPLFDHFHAWEQGIVSITETPFWPMMDEHAALLAMAHSDEQRANLVINLQQTYGNSYLQRLINSMAIQAKLTVNDPNDIYEQEADTVAEAVTRAANSQVQRQAPEEEELQTKALDHIQHAATNAVPEVDSETESKINAARGSGEPLPEHVRSPMGQAFGTDFSRVRVHADANADALSQSLQARAFTAGQDISFRSGEYNQVTSSGQQLIAHELTHVVQQSIGKSVVQRKNNKEPKLLTDFAVEFSDSAELIRKNPEAMKLVKEAQKAGAKYGGYSEDGPSGDAWPYTVEDTVYVPKAQTDKVVAMTDFLFELNNAVRAPEFAKLEEKAPKGKLTGKKYAYDTAELEVEGMLRMGKIWFETKKTIGKGAKWNKYDDDFYLSEYEEFKAGEKSKDDIVKEVLSRTYSDIGITVEEFYIEQYKGLGGTK